MNDDFERQLMRDIAAAARHDPTPAWKADILSAAADASRSSPAPAKRLPRWLLLSWSVCWAAALLLQLLTPVASSTDAALASRDAPPKDAEWRSLLAQQQRINALLALNDPSPTPSTP